ncbi:MAG: redox-sensing transcriptional repressor Rex [Clostridia bacterium]|nr:redox-sensing transcriptional repressor Rex [Clostridia bacterium]
MGKTRIPDVAVKRLPVYLRVLTELQRESVDIISSAELARRTGFSSEQIRKDLAYFGAFGTRGIGYSTDVLSARIRRILGIHRGVNVVLVGCGNLGTALARYNLHRHPDIRVVALFDNDPAKVGTKIEHLTIQPVEELPAAVRAMRARMAILTVPPAAAQSCVDLLVEAGVEAILNFSPTKVDGRGRAHIQNIDLSLELQTLAFYTTGDGRVAGDDRLGEGNR